MPGGSKSGIKRFKKATYALLFIKNGANAVDIRGMSRKELQAKIFHEYVCGLLPHAPRLNPE